MSSNWLMTAAGAALGIVIISSAIMSADGKDKVDTGVGPKGVALESSPAFKKGGVPVDMFNIVRAETAKYFAEETILSGANSMRHERNGIDLKNQTVIRSNFDLIYSYGVYDVSGGLTVTIPPYDLYQSVEIFDENHIILKVVYPGDTVSIGPGDVTFGKHVYLFMRTQPRSLDKAGIKELNQRQDRVVIKAGSAKPYISPVLYDTDSFNALRQKILARAVKGEAKSELGFVESIDSIVFPQYQLANIAGWGGLPARHAFYLLLVPGDGAAARGGCSAMTFSPPDLQYEKNGYWSVTLYDKDGWVATDKFNTNSLKAKKNTDGTYTIHFNCGEDAVNNLQVVPGWNGLFRMYLPKSVDAAVDFRQKLEKDYRILSVKK
jgi:hypothetical protein